MRAKAPGNRLASSVHNTVNKIPDPKNSTNTIPHPGHKLSARVTGDGGMNVIEAPRTSFSLSVPSAATSIESGTDALASPTLKR